MLRASVLLLSRPAIVLMLAMFASVQIRYPIQRGAMLTSCTLKVEILPLTPIAYDCRKHAQGDPLISLY